VFGEEWSAAPLVAKAVVNHDTRVFTFGLSDATKPLGLSTCACILAQGGKDDEGNPVVRPYTPVSTNAMLGKFELMVKVYPQGKLSQHMDGMAIGDTMNFKHIPFNVKTQYPFGKAKLGMIVGGTGITPMIQALHAVLGTGGDTTAVSMLYGSRTEGDILGKETLDGWCASHGDRLKVQHVLSHEPEGSVWQGERGYIDKDRVAKYLPAPSEDCVLFVCGPPPMYAALCGDRGTKELTGLLADMGYSAEQVYKF
jgi:cytochrome-b5 reductase